MRLVIKFPTRSRPEKFKNVLNKYIDYLSGGNEVRFVITCDNDDSTMNNPEMRNWFEQIKNKVDLDVFYGDSKTKVQAVNANLDNEFGDVLLVASDDMVPAALNYDAIIADAFNQMFPNYDGAIKFNDGLRNDQLMTLPCIGWNLYKAIGHVYHPDYISLYCDNEQTRVCGMLNKLAISDICIARHEWIPGVYADGTVNKNADALHQRNESFYSSDLEVFKRRIEKNFDLEFVKNKLNLIMDPNIVFNQTNS